MSTAPTVDRRTNRVSPLSVAASVGVVSLAGGAFVLSFSALRDLAIASGIPSQQAFLWPLIVDGFIVVATACAFALSDRGRRVTWYPWAALVMFSAISVAGNALHAQESANVAVPVVVATIVSAVPAVALLLASHLLVVMVEHSRPRAATPAPSAAPESLGEMSLHHRHNAPAAIAGLQEPETEAPALRELADNPARTARAVVAPDVPAEQPQVTAVDQLPSAASPEPAESVDRGSAESPAEGERPSRDDAAAVIRAALEAGDEPVTKELADQFGVAASTARRWVRETREELERAAA